jgi:hypothetical protein
MSIDAMKQVLEVMDTVAPSVEASAPRYYAARDALRAAIEHRKPVAWRKHYENSGYTYFDERWKTIPHDAEPLFSN